MRCFTAGIVLLICLILPGCRSAPDPVGNWKLSMASKPGSKDNPGAALADAFVKAATIEIKSDHTFVFRVLGMPAEGTWTQNGSELNMTLTKEMGRTKTGQDAGDKFTMKISDDGKSLSKSDSDGGSGSIFVRDEG